MNKAIHVPDILLLKITKKDRRTYLKKILLAMKLTAFFIFILSIQVSAKVYSQKITLSVKNASMETVLDLINQQSGYAFFFNAEQLKQAKPVSISVNQLDLSETLKTVFREQPFTYEVSGKSIIVKPKKGAEKRDEQEEQQPRTISGTVTDSLGNPLQGVTVRIKNTNTGTVTDRYGKYVLNNAPENSITTFSLLGYMPYETTATNTTINIVLKINSEAISEVEVVSTGYQQLPKERATGSFVHIDNELLNRRVSTNILDRLDGVTSGLIFNKNVSPNPNLNQSAISIRGRSTIFSNPEPLIVVDNFPYEGDIGNINPNDISDVTVLKDAAAASIWGASSGNGVIVITTKKGAKNQPSKVHVNSSVNIFDKPDLFYLPRLSSSQVIEVEEFLFQNRYYDSFLTNTSKPYLSPVVEILYAEPDQNNAETMIEPYRHIDNRTGIEQYVYQNQVQQQHALSISGGGQHNQYYFSTGFDKNIGSMVKDKYERITLTARNSFSFLNDRLSISSGIIFTNSNSTKSISSGNPISFGARPYEKIADDEGKPLVAGYIYRQKFIDTVGQGQLLDWNYRPLEEIRNANNKENLTDYRINTELRFQILTGLNIRTLYQYSKGVTNSQNLYDVNSFYTRNLFNRFSQIDYNSGSATSSIPLGDILDANYETFFSHQWRTQLDFDRTFNLRHSISAIAGYEVRSLKAENNPQERLYGYSRETRSSITVNYLDQYPVYFGTSSFIPGNISGFGSRASSTDNNISYYGNASYSYNGRYVISGSARLDQSNIFGVSTNQKGVPLWSTGVAWNLDKEAFYHSDTFPYLRLRVTYGYNGNVDKSTSSFVTARITNNNYFGQKAQYITNPPNPELRWEKIKMVNVGVDFIVKNKIIDGSLEYYTKSGKDLIGFSPFAPQSGITQFKGNVSDMTGEGLDLSINSRNINGTFKWFSSTLVNYTTDKVVNYQNPIKQVSDIFAGTSLTPVDGKPLYSVYSYKWAELDNSGNPQGYWEGSPSTNYTAIFQSSDVSTLTYHGTANPTWYGSLRNTFSYQHVNLSFNISYKFDYYFRHNLNATDIFSGFMAYPNMDDRWRSPGDEGYTNVPSLVYPANVARTSFYLQSEIQVLKGDHIRLQDIQLSYALGSFTHKIGLRNVEVYCYANNIGLLWKANNKNIDPDFVSAFPNTKTYAIGLNFDL